MAESTSNSQNNEENELTMCDVLKEEQELEEDANAVLGGSDDTNCSYEKGYVSRQALYACTTCSINEELGGVCLACSYKCHDGHEIVELYTKRNFRCDCGNSKFPDKTCSLKPDKEPINVLNKYNQNFKGVYCSCSRPYPDLDDHTPDEMVQCIMCEDWYHGRHIGGIIPEDYFEMICSKCMGSHKFLYKYLNKFQYANVIDSQDEMCNGTLKKEFAESEIKTENELSPNHPYELNLNEDLTKQETIDTSTTAATIDSGLTGANAAIKIEKEPLIHLQDPALNVDNIKKETFDSPTTTAAIDSECNVALNKTHQETAVKTEVSDACLFKLLVIKSDGICSGPAFWPENWRKELCHCSVCMIMYGEYECAYLINLDDTILAYEESGKSANESQYDKGLSALSQLDRVKQMEAIRAYTSMKGQLKEYLKEFASNKRTVCESDIKEFFDRISKRQKLNNGIPHFCR